MRKAPLEAHTPETLSGRGRWVQAGKPEEGPTLDLTESTRQLLRHLGDAHATSQLPFHVFVRAAALCGDEDLLYVDEGLEREGVTWTGSVLVVTTTRVILATVDQAPADAGDADTTRIRATRRTGTVAEIEGPDLAWMQDWGPQWPKPARLRIQWAGTEPVLLPLKPDIAERREALLKALPGLLLDS